MNLKNILENDKLTKDEILFLLSIESPNDIVVLKLKAYDTLRRYCGEKVHLRGLIEFSNHCVNDCYYCGIRKTNTNLKRYSMTKNEILECAVICANKGFGSIVLQSGERCDKYFIEFIEDIIDSIKKITVSDKLPNGLGITLSIGEQTYESYQRFYIAGAHRYLLRIESSNEKLFTSLHNKSQDFKKRVECLYMLKEIGYQVGTGVMIGLPNQTIEHLADDIIFFKEMDIDMIGMGPYLVHKDTPMSHLKKDYQKLKDNNYLLALKMIAVTRLYLKDVNIASTTALQAIKPLGREAGLSFGANVFMPQVTPVKYRKDYQLYDGKPCIDESSEMCAQCSEFRIRNLNREIAYNDWGDSKHFTNKYKT